VHPSEASIDMENETTSTDQGALYAPLNKTAHEIRLLTIKQCLPKQPLQCHLETVSLTEVRPEYASFISSNGLSEQTPRQIKHKWTASHQTIGPRPHLVADEEEDDNEEDRFLGSVPEPSLYRYRWGDFAALSYVWGDGSLRKTIILNGQQMLVTANLERALRTLAQDRVFDQDYKLWVDAVCINQADDQERPHQIQKMREIYSSSWAVVAWIGTGHPIVEYAFPFLEFLATLEGEQRNLIDLVLPPGAPSLAQYLYALSELMKQDYWFRLWIIQELIMGASSTVLRHGDQLISWQTFLKGLGVLYHGSNWLFKDNELRRARGNVSWHTYGMHLVHMDLRQLTRAEEEEEPGASRLKFRRLLDMANSSKCRDMKDKVFALVGMMDPAIAADIMQAYEFKPPKLFAAVARAFIVHTNNLEALRHGNPWGPAGGPSWAADWTWPSRIRFSRPEYNMAGPLCDASEPEVDPDTIYCAHGGIPASYQFIDDWRLLQCHGFIFDEVSGLGAPEAGFFKWDEGRIVQCSTWRSAYGDAEATGRALWNTLLLSVILRGERAQDCHAALLNLPSSFYHALEQFQVKKWDWLSGQAGYYFKWQLWRNAHENFMLGQQTLGSFFTDVIPGDADEKTYIEVYCSAQRTVQQRRFILTKQGYFGWGPDNVYNSDLSKELRVGDKIAIVFGCSTPLVIRPKGGQYEVVGEAYVQGFMDGEAMGLVESGQCEVKAFTFC